MNKGIYIALAEQCAELVHVVLQALAGDWPPAEIESEIHPIAVNLRQLLMKILGEEVK